MMEFNEQDIIKILNIHARALKKLDLMAMELIEEIYNEKVLVSNIYKHLKEEVAQEQTPQSSDNKEPDNVIRFPFEE